MECDNMNERIQAYLEGLLGSEEGADVERHLAGCERCAASLEEIRKTVHLLKGLDEVEPPPWMTHKVMTMVRAEASPKRGLLDLLFRPLSVKLPIEALAVVLLGVATYYVFKAVEPEVSVVQQPAGVPHKEAPSKALPPPPQDALPVDRKGFPEPPRASEDHRAALRKGQEPPAAAPVQAAREEKDVQSKDREETKAPEGVRRQESSASRTPAGSAPKPPEPALPARGPGKVDMAPASPAAVPLGQEERLKTAKSEERAKAYQSVAAVRVYVRDPGSAELQVKEAVERSQGAVSRKEDIPGGTLIHVRLDAGKFSELLAGLRSIGRTEGDATAPAVREGTSEFAIAVLREESR